MLQSMGSQSDTTERLNSTELTEIDFESSLVQDDSAIEVVILPCFRTETEFVERK